MRVLPGVLPVGMQDFLHGVEPAVPREVRGGTESIHVFSINGLDLAYDGASGALHRLDDVGRETLLWVLRHPEVMSDAVPHVAPAGLFSDLAGLFSQEDIAAAWSELRDLAGLTLFGKDVDAELTAEAGGSSDQATEADQVGAGVKALCLDVAHDCNLMCAYCFASQGRFGGKPVLMSPETGEAAVDFLLKTSRDRRYLDVDFFGGEPLMAFDTVRHVVSYAREQGKRRGKEFRFTLTTNCTLLDDEKTRFLNSEGISLILSIDGRPSVHDLMRKLRSGGPSHAIAIDKARRIVDSRGGRDYFLRGTYTRHNLDFDQDVRYLYDAGFRRLSLEPAVGDRKEEWTIGEDDIPRVKQSYGRLAAFWADAKKAGDPFEFYHFNLGLTGGMCRERRVTGCGAGYEYVAVTPEGQVYPCHQMVGDPTYVMGNIATGISRPEMESAFYRARIPSKPQCRTCWARYLCGGGCHARAIGANDDLLRPDPLSCLVVKTRLEYALYAQILAGA